LGDRFLHQEGNRKRDEGGNESEVDGEADDGFFSEVGSQEIVEKGMIINGAADEHGDDEGAGGERHEPGENFGPLGFLFSLGE